MSFEPCGIRRYRPVGLSKTFSVTWAVIVNQKQEYVAVRSIQRGRISSDIDPGIVDARRPVEHPGDLPASIPDAVPSNPLHRRNQFMIVDAAIVGAGDSAQFNTSILDLECFDQLGTMGGQAVLKIDSSQRCWELTQIGSRCADQGRELPEAPVGWHKRDIFAWEHQR